MVVLLTVVFLSQVGPDRMQKLQSVLEKVFGRFGTIVRRYYPVDETTQMFKGYVYIHTVESFSSLGIQKCSF